MTARRLTEAEAVKQLDAIPSGGDPDGAHGEADEVLLRTVPKPVADAYRRLVARADWWATA